MTFMATAWTKKTSAIYVIAASLSAVFGSFPILRWGFTRYWEWQHGGRPMVFVIGPEDNAATVATLLSIAVLFLTLRHVSRKRPLSNPPALPAPDWPRFPWIYAAPALHLFTCLIAIIAKLAPRLNYLRFAGEIAFLVDFPISTVFWMLLWTQHSILGGLWIVVVGTLWWYLLSVGVRRLLRKAWGE
jgi:hypothetical protein